MFNNPPVHQIFAILTMCIIKFSKFCNDPREAGIVMSLVSFVSSIIFLYCSATNNALKRQMVISITAFVSALSCFTTLNFSVEGSKRILDFIILAETGLVGLVYLFISSQAPLVRLLGKGVFLRKTRVVVYMNLIPIMYE